MKLIIAEKPELGRAIAGAIPGQGKTENACIYKGDYAVVWAYGHLLTLKEPEDYDVAYKQWSLETLPIYFPDWGQKPGESGSKGYGVSKADRIEQIGQLLGQCECVIHAGDPDDEGQYLIDEILRWHNYTGPVYRMNTNDTTPAALNKALNNLSDNKPCEAAGWSAHARSVADMMVGCNCSRYFTLNNPGVLLTVGRVQTSTLGLVVARDLAIEGHQKQSYFDVTAKLSISGAEVQAQYEPAENDQNLVDGRMTSQTYAQTKVDMLKYETLRNVEITYADVSEKPPLPFNLTELQSYCSGKFGYDPTEVLEITQSLRDNHGAITYNRSDCRYLTEEQYKGAGATMNQVIQNIGYSPKGLDMSLHSRCYDDSRVTAHTAIIPQNKALDVASLTDKERNVYLAICKYFMMQFMPPAKKGRTKLNAPLADGGRLTATSTVVVEPGYLTLVKKDSDFDADEAGPLSSVKPGTYTAEVLDAGLEEKQTKAPSRYTKASLNKDMTRIARYVEDPDVKQLLLNKDKDKEGENGSIGTVATRGTIIDKLVERGYCEMQGQKIISTPLGRELYRILPDELKKPDMTAYWWAIQEDIRDGATSWTKLTDSVLDMIRRVVSTKYPAVDMNLIPASLRRSGASREVLGTCPDCGGDVVEGKMGFGCMGYKNGCRFIIWKDSKLPMMQKEKVTPAQVKKWLEAWEDNAEGGRITKNSVHFKKLFSQNKDKTFEGDLFLVYDGAKEYPLSFRFATQEDMPVLGICPRCGGEVKESGFAFSCSNSGKNGDCKFVNVDVTWDNEDAKDGQDGHAEYDFFLLGDDEFRETHVWDQYPCMPVAEKSCSENYASRKEA